MDGFCRTGFDSLRLIRLKRHKKTFGCRGIAFHNQSHTFWNTMSSLPICSPPSFPPEGEDDVTIVIDGYSSPGSKGAKRSRRCKMFLLLAVVAALAAMVFVIIFDLVAFSSSLMFTSSSSTSITGEDELVSLHRLTVDTSQSLPKVNIEFQLDVSPRFSQIIPKGMVCRYTLPSEAEDNKKSASIVAVVSPLTDDSNTFSLQATCPPEDIHVHADMVWKLMTTTTTAKTTRSSSMLDDIVCDVTILVHVVGKDWLPIPYSHKVTVSPDRLEHAAKGIAAASTTSCTNNTSSSSSSFPALSLRQFNAETVQVAQAVRPATVKRTLYPLFEKNSVSVVFPYRSASNKAETKISEAVGAVCSKSEPHPNFFKGEPAPLVSRRLFRVLLDLNRES